jgi:hypothetical protein
MDMQKKKTVLSNVIKMVQDHPVLYSGKEIHIVYFGIFSALNAMAILTSFYYYLYIHGCYVSASSFYMLPIGGLMVWAGARLMHDSFTKACFQVLTVRFSVFLFRTAAGEIVAWQEICRDDHLGVSRDNTLLQ